MTDRRHPYDGRPYYCQNCGDGLGEYLACEEPQCELETRYQAEARRKHKASEVTSQDRVTD
jgi:hypothetical protein